MQLPIYFYNLSILFGLAGTLIVFCTLIRAFVYKIKETMNEYFMLSQAIGFAFLFNSFIYNNQLLPVELSFIHFLYYAFIIFAIYISLFLIKELDFYNLKGIWISARNDWEYSVLILIIFVATVIHFENSDPIPFLNLILFSIVYIFKIKKIRRIIVNPKTLK